MFRLYQYFFIFILLFSQGIFELSGISGAYPKYLAEILIVGLFVKKIIEIALGNTRIIFPGLKYALFSGIVVIISAVLNGKSIVEIALFTKIIYVYYFLFITLVNENFSQKELNRFYSFFKALFVIQLIAVGIKYSILGISEAGGIGTISLASGSLSTILPMFASCYLLAMYFYTKNYKYVIGIFCFTALGIIGEKRAIVFFIPLTFFIVLLLFQTKRATIISVFKQKSFLKNFLLLLLASIIAVYAIVRLSPTLNPDNEIGGRFSFSYAIEYGQKYTTRDKVDNAYAVGRTVAPLLAYKTVESYGSIHLLLGMGPGDLIESAFLPGNYTGRNMKILEKYGIGYGGRSGFIWLFMQVGIVGTLLFLMIIIKLYKRINKIYKNSDSRYLQALALGFLGSVFVYFIDLGIYSRTMITQTAIVSVFFAMPALIIQHNKLARRDK
jgi:hypothetical protein